MLVIIIVIVSIAACFIDRPIKAAMRRSALNEKAARLAALIEKAKEAAALCDDSNLGQQSLRLFKSACECYADATKPACRYSQAADSLLDQGIYLAKQSMFWMFPGDESEEEISTP